MTIALLTAGVIVILAGLGLVGGVVAVRIRQPRYDVPAAMAAHRARKAAGAEPSVYEAADAEEVVS